GMPEAVSDRPPRKGPTIRYFIPLNNGSSFLAGSAVSIFGVACAAGEGLGFSGFVFCAIPAAGKSTTKNRQATNLAQRVLITIVLDPPGEFWNRSWYR